MDKEREELSGAELVRWAVVAVIIIAGIALFFYFAPSADPVVPPTVQESAP
jgi:Na+/proline symporter